MTYQVVAIAMQNHCNSTFLCNHRKIIAIAYYHGIYCYGSQWIQLCHNRYISQRFSAFAMKISVARNISPCSQPWPPRTQANLQEIEILYAQSPPQSNGRHSLSQASKQWLPESLTSSRTCSSCFFFLWLFYALLFITLKHGCFYCPRERYWKVPLLSKKTFIVRPAHRWLVHVQTGQNLKGANVCFVEVSYSVCIYGSIGLIKLYNFVQLYVQDFERTNIGIKFNATCPLIRKLSHYYFGCMGHGLQICPQKFLKKYQVYTSKNTHVYSVH